VYLSRYPLVDKVHVVDIPTAYKRRSKGGEIANPLKKLREERSHICLIMIVSMTFINIHFKAQTCFIVNLWVVFATGKLNYKANLDSLSIFDSKTSTTIAFDTSKYSHVIRITSARSSRLLPIRHNSMSLQKSTSSNFIKDSKRRE
jgi:hypothetical protein